MRGPKPKVPRPVKLNLCLPEDLNRKVKLHLKAIHGGKPPKGAYQVFFEGLLCEFFTRLKCGKG